MHDFVEERGVWDFREYGQMSGWWIWTDGGVKGWINDRYLPPQLGDC